MSAIARLPLAALAPAQRWVLAWLLVGAAVLWGTTIQAKAIDITATSGDITATAAKIEGQDISLEAAKAINLQAGANTTTLQNSSESHSLGAGVTIGLGPQSGVSFQLSASQGNANANGSETTYDNTRISASNTLSVKSGTDTNLVGAQLAGNSVKMDVGGDLNIVTLQDKSKFDSEQHSSGINLSVCVPPICYGSMVTGSVSKSDATLNHNYQSASGQSGIAAGGKDGSGGYTITVKGNTDLKGGAITSTADKDHNTLTTASLTSSDLANSQNTSASSSSLSLGYGGGSVMSTLVDNVKTNALSSLANQAGGAGMPATGSSTGTTQSVIGNGTVILTGTGDTAKDAASNAQVATLTTRDPAKANGGLQNNLTLQQASQVQADRQKAAENAQAANLAGAAMDGMIGDIAQKNKWPEGSPEKTVLHGLSGWVQANIGGTNGLSGFAAGAVNEQLTQPMSNYIAKNCASCVARNADGSVQLDTNGNPMLNADGKALLLAGSTLVGAGTAAVMGAKPTDQAAAGNIAKNATEFNYLDHRKPSLLRLSEKERYEAAVSGCAAGDLSACERRDQLANLSKQRDAELAAACSGGTPGFCNDKKTEAMAMGNTVVSTPNGVTYANSTATGSVRTLNTSTVGASSDPRAGTFHDTVSRSTSEAIVLEVGNQTVGALVGIGLKGFSATKTAVIDFFASEGVAISDTTAARIANNFTRDGDSFTAAAAKMNAAKSAGWKTPDGRTWWPPGSGEVPGTSFETTLPVGAKLDRFGGTTDRSTFLAPSGTPLEQRALSPSTNTSIRDVYEVIKPLPVEQSNVMPWFGQPGMGVQFDTSKGAGLTINELIKQGYLKKISP